MISQVLKRCVVTLILSCVLLLLLSGCAPSFTCSLGLGCVARPTPQVYKYTPINTTVIPHVTVVAELDTPPLQSAEYFYAMLKMLADKVDASIVPGEMGIDVFVGAITHKSIGKELLSFHVPAVPSDKPKPVLPVCPTEADSNETPTHFANREAACDQANTKAIADWQSFLKTNHELLSQVQMQTKQYTDAMRHNLKPVDDNPISDDVWGAVSDASSHFAHFSSGEKVLILASPMENNTLIDQTENITLTGVVVRVDFFSCAVSASYCDNIKTFWTQKLKSFGASSVTFYSPLDSQDEQPTF